MRSLLRSPSRLPPPRRASVSTVGTFFVPGVHVEEMYHPETFGRGACERVVVER